MSKEIKDLKKEEIEDKTRFKKDKKRFIKEYEEKIETRKAIIKEELKNIKACKKGNHEIIYIKDYDYKSRTLPSESVRDNTFKTIKGYLKNPRMNDMEYRTSDSNSIKRQEMNAQGNNNIYHRNNNPYIF